MADVSELKKIAKRCAFLHAHLDYDNAFGMLNRELKRLYECITEIDGGDEPDLTFCSWCREEIEQKQETYVSGGSKYHIGCI